MTKNATWRWQWALPEPQDTVLNPFCSFYHGWTHRVVFSCTGWNDLFSGDDPNFFSRMFKIGCMFCIKIFQKSECEKQGKSYAHIYAKRKINFKRPDIKICKNYLEECFKAFIISMIGKSTHEDLSECRIFLCAGHSRGGTQGWGWCHPNISREIPHQKSADNSCNFFYIISSVACVRMSQVERPPSSSCYKL